MLGEALRLSVVWIVLKGGREERAEHFSRRLHCQVKPPRHHRRRRRRRRLALPAAGRSPPRSVSSSVAYREAASITRDLA